MPARIRGRIRTTTTENRAMGLFDRIKEKLGFGHPDETQPAPGKPLGGTTTAAGGATAAPGVTPPPTTPVTGAAPMSQVDRSEERRVGKEGRSRWSPSE